MAVQVMGFTKRQPLEVCRRPYVKSWRVCHSAVHFASWAMISVAFPFFCCVMSIKRWQCFTSIKWYPTFLLYTLLRPGDYVVYILKTGIKFSCNEGLKCPAGFTQFVVKTHCLQDFTLRRYMLSQTRVISTRIRGMI